MSTLSKVQLIVIFAAVLLAVLLFFAPNNPPLPVEVLPEKVEIKGDSSAQAGKTEEKLRLAISFVQEGKEPMKGIMLLREVLEKDSNNLKAHFYLGLFSMQSGQWEKARLRFLKVLELDSSQNEANFHMARVNANLGDTASALAYLKIYKRLNGDSNLPEEVNALIKELKK